MRFLNGMTVLTLGLRRLIVALGFILMAATAHAGAFDAEKQAGLVGEKSDGYIGIVSSAASPALVRQVDELNLKRRQHYREIAGKNGTNLSAVEAIFGKKLIERAASGEFVNPGGGWQQKP